MGMSHLKVIFVQLVKIWGFQDFTETGVLLLLHWSPEPKDECKRLNILGKSNK